MTIEPWQRNFLVGLLIDQDIFLDLTADPDLFTEDGAASLVRALYTPRPPPRSSPDETAAKGPSAGVRCKGNCQGAKNPVPRVPRVGLFENPAGLVGFDHVESTLPCAQGPPFCLHAGAVAPLDPLLLFRITILASGRMPSEGLWHKDRAEVKEILDACANDPYHRVRVNALVGLHFLHDPQAVVRLQELAASENLAFQKAAVWAMGCLGRRVVPSLPGSPPRQIGPAHARSLASRDGANTPATPAAGGARHESGSHAARRPSQ